MSELSSDLIPEIIANCRQNCESLTQSFNRCFDTQFRLVTGEPQPWDRQSVPQTLSGPGLLVTIQVGERAILLPFPGSLLPAWSMNPSPEERAWLQALPTEWAFNLLPADLAANHTSCHKTDNLAGAINVSVPAPDAVLLPLMLCDNAAEAEGATPLETIWMVWPVTSPPSELADTFALDHAAAEQADPGGTSGSHGEWRGNVPLEPAASAASEAAEMNARRIRQILKLPVPVIVKLAEKRIPLGQALALGPGVIVTFEKSCEDLLDLCINNQVYCRGEAVKIGEKFGLKVNQVNEPQQMLLQGKVSRYR